VTTADSLETHATWSTVQNTQFRMVLPTFAEAQITTHIGGDAR
jgi:hypothetical protein